MKTRKARFRHLPPTAVPIKGSDLRSGLRPSPNSLQQFTVDLAAYLGIAPDACRLASSGRTALYCLLQGLKLENRTRNQIIIPAYTCPAVARVAIDLQLQPLFVDLSPETFYFDQDQLAAAVGEHTLAVILVHPFGIPLPVEEIKSLTNSAGAVLIEDAAQALGARQNNQPVGTQGDYGLFSLGPGKPISTGGGGIAISNHPQGIQVLAQGWAELPEQGGVGSTRSWLRQAIFQLAFQPHAWWVATQMGLHRVGNHETSWGYSLTNLTPSQAGTGRALLSRLDVINVGRKRHAARLSTALQQSVHVHAVRIEENADPIYLRFPIITESEQQREQLFAKLWSEGIGAGRLYEASLPSIYPMYATKSYPGAEAVAGRLITLPTHHFVTESDLQVMSQILAQT
ncbi:MAG: DegT/DnrJ/EryC1/StrS family aminotransferase [Candidatus Promineifilaceae bacterium]|nr:DegT/DnrJ/EryC1/StrS family aminotransferase [Candidatus Promineifilaceae bacterium]